MRIKSSLIAVCIVAASYGMCDDVTIGDLVNVYGDAYYVAVTNLCASPHLNDIVERNDSVTLSNEERLQISILKSRLNYPEVYKSFCELMGEFLRHSEEAAPKTIDHSMVAKIIKFTSMHRENSPYRKFVGIEKTKYGTRAKEIDVFISDDELETNKEKNRAARLALVEFYIKYRLHYNDCVDLTILEAIECLYTDKYYLHGSVGRLAYDGIESFADIVEMSNVDCARKEDSPNNQGNATNENQK